MILLAKVVIELFYHCVVETKRETRLCFIQGRGHIVWKDQRPISFELGNVYRVFHFVVGSVTVVKRNGRCDARADVLAREALLACTLLGK